ncbi:hypothetical protein GZ77_03680 [Endozoicomonas montiporae]|uniref:Diphthamide synthase domain-containing protein n=2 Tax=Endozoicomonas montiporae TaxID=1027273 RepID=A0A081NB64_9GAMM|nr:diphthine--ammonia ligase [Endozoicomonas montiporae]AMO56598.1 hypothetical protein EZMO1_2519 [Endozoicomonas montiporae CL-33]KEQ15687.1 hypothetical protein GZ77_03680 [Endozoicomonas montiporae]
MLDNPQHAIISWSGGKDACYALHLARQSGFIPVALFTMLSEDGEHTSAYGLNKEVLEAQANALNLPILFRSSGRGEYEQQLKSVISECQNRFNATTVVFGDIDLEAHKVWYERVTAEADIAPCFPLWQRNREQLLNEMLDAGITTMLVSVQSKQLPKDFLGQIMTPELAVRIKQSGVCPSGEDGEFHSLVIDAPLFSKSLNIKTGDCRMIEHGYTALDISLQI